MAETQRGGAGGSRRTSRAARAVRQGRCREGEGEQGGGSSTTSPPGTRSRCRLPPLRPAAPGPTAGTGRRSDRQRLRGPGRTRMRKSTPTRMQTRSSEGAYLCKLVSRQGGEQGGEERGENAGQFSAPEPRNTKKLRQGLPGEEVTATEAPATPRLLPAAGPRGRESSGGVTAAAPLDSRAPFWRERGLTGATLGGNNPFQPASLPWLSQGISLPASEPGAGYTASPRPTCSARCHASPCWHGPRVPTVAGCTAGRSQLSPPRCRGPAAPHRLGPTGSACRQSGARGHRAALWAVIRQRPLASSLTGRAGGRHAAPRAPLVPRRPRGRGPRCHPPSKPPCASPTQHGHGLGVRGSGTGLLRGTPPPLRAGLWGEPTSAAPLVLRELPAGHCLCKAHGAGGAAQPCSLLLPSATSRRMWVPEAGTPTLRGVGAAP